MYPIPPLYADYLRRTERTFLIKADVGSATYDNTVVVDFTIENSLALGEEFEIGTAILSKLTIKLRTNDVIAPNARIVPYLALSMDGVTWQDADFPWEDADFPWEGGSLDWIPLGEFFVDNRERVNDVWVFTCYDKLVWADVPYISSLSYPASMQDVWDEICDRLDYTYDSSVNIDPSYQIQAGPAGYSYRQVMGYIASANSASVFVGKDGEIRFRRFVASETPVFSVSGSDYVRVVQTNPLKTYTRVVVTYNTEDGLTYEAGSGNDNHTLYVENPFATQEITDDLLSALNGFTYLPVTMDAMGYPQLDQGDRIGFTADEGLTWDNATIAWNDMDVPWDGIVNYETVILSQTFGFKGGLKMAIDAPSKSEQQSEFVVEGTLAQQVNRLNNNAVKLGRSYYGATITRTEGLIVEREDHASKAVFNSDELTFYKGASKALWFDVPTDTYKFTGVIEASSFVGGNIVIGSGNNVFKADSSGIWAGHANFASAPFRVNMAGQMTAVGGTFSGAISASTITGGTISGATINGTNINGGTITGATIQTSATFPQSVMSVSGAMFGVYNNANNYLLARPNLASNAPELVVFESGAQRGSLSYDAASNIFGIFSDTIAGIRAVGHIRFNPIGGVVLTDDFSKYAAGSPSSYTTLNQRLLGNVIFNPASNLLKFYSMSGTELFSVDLSSLA